MRIMFVIPRMNNGGSERVVANLGNYFCKEDDVRVVSVVSNESYYKLDDRVTFRGQSVVINRKNLFTTFMCYSKFFAKSIKHIKNNVNDFKPDVVISFLFETDLLTYLALKDNKNIVRVFSERNDPTRRSCLKNLILKRIYKSADLFICQTKKISDYYSYIPRAKKLVIPNPLNGRIFGKISKERNHDIISVGRLCRQKNFPLLINSFADVINLIPEDTRLIIYGDGPMRQRLQKLIHQRGMDKKIILAGKEKNIFEKIRTAALFVLPSNYEGFPNALLEAMAVGLPVVSTNFYSGAAEELIGKKNGVLVQVDSRKEMSDAILRLMNNGNIRNEMRKINVLMSTRYSVDKIAAMWKNALERVVEKKNQKRITLFISSLSGGGAERVTANLANYLSEHDYGVDVITMSNRNDTYVLNKKVRRICLLNEEERTNRLRDFFIRNKRLKGYIKNNRNVACYITMLPVTIFMLIRLKKFTPSKIIISERIDPKSHSFLKKMMMKYSVKKCDGLVVQTEEISNWYNFAKNKIVIPNAINMDIKIMECNQRNKIIVAVGRLEKQKNYPMLIEAFSLFSVKHPEYKLEIFGQGSQKELLEKLVDRYGMKSKIKFMGYVHDVANRIYNAACFVMTSDYEGMPNALIEAMCIGAPCISTDSDGGGARELIDNNENGILIQKDAVNELVESLEKITSNKAFSNRLSKNAKMIRQKLAPDMVYGIWKDYIVKVVGEG